MSDAISLRVIAKNGIPLTGAKYELLDQDGSHCFATIQRTKNDDSAVLVHFPENEDTVTVRASRDHWSETCTFGKTKIQYDFASDITMPDGNDNNFTKRLTASSFAVGIGFLLLILSLSTIYPDPTPAQRQIWQAILSVGLAAFANGILGLLEVTLEIPKVGLTIRAIGAIGIAVIVYFFVPAFA
jgi:hypothetical protein